MGQFIDFDVVDEHGVQALEEKLVLAKEDLGRAEVAERVILLVKVKAAVGEVEGEYVATGTLEAETKLICSRCLELFPFAERSKFAVRYRPRAVEPEELEDEFEIDDGGLDIGYYRERKVSLSELVAEQVQLAIPMKVVCREDCKGLCPSCGKNRNLESCSCETDVTDERWQGLEQFRRRLEKQTEK